jgi:hypothetical protein
VLVILFFVVGCSTSRAATQETQNLTHEKNFLPRGTWNAKVDFGENQGIFNLSLYINTSALSDYEKKKNPEIQEKGILFSSALLVMDKDNKRGENATCKAAEEIHLPMTGGSAGPYLFLQGVIRSPEVPELIIKMSTLRVDLRKSDSNQLKAMLITCFFLGNGGCRNFDINFSKANF